MTKKQAKQFCQMAKALSRIKLYMTPAQIRKDCKGGFGPGYEEYLEMSYENIQIEAKGGMEGIGPKAIQQVANICNALK